MIMWSGQEYPIYDLTPPAGMCVPPIPPLHLCNTLRMYGHIEPVIGVQSNHPLNDSTVYDDDEVRPAPPPPLPRCIIATLCAPTSLAHPTHAAALQS